MKQFFQISFLAGFMISCTVYQIDSQKKIFFAQEGVIENKYFSKIGEEHIFRANVSAFSKEISGLFVVKKINDSLHRAVLTSDFGNTLFDFSLYSDSFSLNYVMEDLNKNIITRTLGNDFLFLVKNSYWFREKAETKSTEVYKTRLNRKNLFIVKDKNHVNFKKMIIASKFREKVTYEFFDNLTEHKIIIKHKDIPLTIRLK